MGKYTTDELLRIRKDDVALRQLTDSINLFIKRRYLSAITLAGAADAIFCGLLSEDGRQTPAERTWEQIEVHRERGIAMAGQITKKDAFKKWNSTRNRLKHHDADRDCNILEIYEIDEAYEAIKRACYSAYLLGLAPNNFTEFEAHTIPWLFLGITGT